MRKGDLVARLGGDEFAAVLDDIGDPGNASIIADKIIDGVSRCLEVGSHRVSVGASVGIAIYERDDETAEGLIKRADAAMYRAKSQQRSQYCYCDASPSVALKASVR